MKHTVLEAIQSELSRLDESESLWLLEQIARRLRLNVQKSRREAQLMEMAQDPDIQREIAQIETEFSSTLMDGISEDFHADKRSAK